MRMKVYQVVDGTEFTKFVHSWTAPVLSVARQTHYTSEAVVDHLSSQILELRDT